ncbi:hypothetical protein EMCRGX_G014767 [Ephydatia muelleri]
MARVCRRTGAKQLGGRSTSSKQWTNLLTCPTGDNEASETEVCNVRDVSTVPFRVSVRSNGACLKMELDTAAAASVILEDAKTVVYIVAGYVMYYATVQVVVTATTSAAPYGIREGARKVVPSAKQVEEYIGALFS